jgi:hypothetical protein
VHFDGLDWSIMDWSSGYKTYPLGIRGTSHSNVFVVGSNGLIKHYDGISWSPMDSGTTETLTSVWGVVRNGE